MLIKWINCGASWRNKRPKRRKNINNRAIGTKYEVLAAEYLKEQGIRVIEQNYRCPQGEIDIIASDGRYLLFVEVKYRSNTDKGYPAEAVTAAKQRRIRKTARYYQWEHRLPEEIPIRFDVISILGRELQYIQNAF